MLGNGQPGGRPPIQQADGADADVGERVSEPDLSIAAIVGLTWLFTLRTPGPDGSAAALS